MTVVLDASAVLALLWGEPGAEAVEAVAGEASVGAANLAEVAAKLVDRGLGPDTVRQVIGQLNSGILSVGPDEALDSGLLREATRAAGLSLGDRLCLAAARARQARVLTADRSWAVLNVGVEIEVIR